MSDVNVDQVLQNFQNYYQYKNTPEGRLANQTNSFAISAVAWASSAAQASVFGPAAVDGVMGSTVLNLPDNAYSRGFAYFSAFDSMGSNLLLGVACTESFIKRVIHTFKGAICKQAELKPWEFDILAQTSGFQNAMKFFAELTFLGLATTASLPFLCLPVFRNNSVKVDPDASFFQQFLAAFSDVPGDVLGLGVFQFVTTIPVIATGLFELKDSIAEMITRVSMDNDKYRVELIRDCIVATIKEIRDDIDINNKRDFSQLNGILQQDRLEDILRDLLKLKLKKDHVSDKEIHEHIAKNSRSNMDKFKEWLLDYNSYAKRAYLAIAYTACISSLLGYADYAASLLAFGSVGMYCTVFALVFVPLAGLTMRSTGPVALGLLNACMDMMSSIYQRFQVAFKEGFGKAVEDITLENIKGAISRNKVLLVSLLLTVACGFPNLHVNELFMNPADHTGVLNAVSWFLLGSALVSAPAVNGYYGHKVLTSMMETTEEEKLRETDPDAAQKLIDARYRLDSISDYVQKLHNEKLDAVIEQMHNTIRKNPATEKLDQSAQALKHCYANAGMSAQQIHQTFFKPQLPSTEMVNPTSSTLVAANTA